MTIPKKWSDAMERIRPTDLPPLSATPDTSPSGSTATTDCPGCGGAGYYLLRVPYGHADWGKPQRCECMAGKPLPGHVAMLSRLAGDLGHLADCTFETFDTDRRLSTFVWDYDGATYS